MAKVFYFMFLATIVLGINWLRGCDSAVELIQLYCPYYNSTACDKTYRVIECTQDSDCTSITGADSKCCTYECNGLHCVAKKQLCSAPQYGLNGKPCPPLAYGTLCWNSTACGAKASCCNVGCGAAQCEAKKKSGKCPVETTTTSVCTETSTTQCSSDTNCFGSQKCCYTHCHGWTCTNPA